MSLELHQLTKSYAGRLALSPLTASLPPGTTGLIGANGAGKSTLLRLLALGIKPSDGSIRWDDGSPVTRSQVSLMPQHAALPRNQRVVDVLTYFAWLREIPRAHRARACLEALEKVGLSDRAKDRVGSLSGGMHQRLLLAQAILTRPRVLLLDEPTAGLDPAQRVAVRQLIRGIAHDSPAMITLVSSHVLGDLTPVAENILMLDEGVLRFEGAVEQLREIGRRATPEDSEGLSLEEIAFLDLRDHGRLG